jgi:hypothetical protein
MPSNKSDRAHPHLLLVDKPGGGSGCACGGATDPDLPRVAGDLEWLRWEGVTVERVDPMARPAVLRENGAVRTHVEAHGLGVLPLVVVDGTVRHEGSYPTREQLARACGLGGAAPRAAEKEG